MIRSFYFPVYFRLKKYVTKMQTCFDNFTSDATNSTIDQKFLHYFLLSFKKKYTVINMKICFDNFILDATYTVMLFIRSFYFTIKIRLKDYDVIKI